MECWTCEIEECFEKYQKPLRIIGVFPFKLNSNGLKVNKVSLVFSLLVGMILLLASVINLFNNDKNSSDPIVLRYLKHILLLSMSITHFVTITSLILNKNYLKSIFNTIKRVNYRLPIIKPKISFIFPLCSTLFILVSFLMFQFLIPSAHLAVNPPLFHILTFFNNCTLHLYTISLLLIKGSFDGVIKLMKVKSKLIKNLNILLDSFDLLLNTCDDLNRCFGLILLCIMTTNFCLLTIAFFDVLRTVNGIFEVIINFVMISIFSAQVLYLAWVTSSTIEKVNEVKNSLIKYSYEQYNDHSFLNVILLLQNKSLTFTAHGFFDVNYRMVCSMAGGITTYIVVLIQIGIK